MNNVYFLLLMIMHIWASPPVFNRNYAYTTKSATNRYILECLPNNCTNNTDGCIIISDATNAKFRKIISVKNISGSVFVVSKDGRSIFEVPSYEGFGLFAYDYRRRADYAENKKSCFIRVFRNSVLYDSIQVPTVLLTKENTRIITTRGEIDASKVIRIKDDSIAVVTCRGVISFSTNDNNFRKKIIKASYLNNYKNLSFKSSKKCVYDLFIDYKSCPPERRLD